MLSSAPFRGQRYITSALERLGYNQKADGRKFDVAGGVCAGSAKYAIENYLLDNLDTVKTRIIDLHAIWQAAEQLEESHPKYSRKRKRLDEQLQQPANTTSLRMINLYQNSLSLRQLLGTSLSQSKVVDISKLVATP